MKTRDFVNLLKILVPVVVLYSIYSFLVLRPSDIEYFSLVDDGQVLIQSSKYYDDCIKGEGCRMFLDQVFEFGTYRFRPAYWIINIINYKIFSLNVEFHHIFRVFGIGTLVVASLAYYLNRMSVKWYIAIPLSITFFVSKSFTENILRLGTNEPYQIIFISVFTLFFLRFIHNRSANMFEIFSSVAILFITLSVKENNVAILAVILSLMLFKFGRSVDYRKYFFIVGAPLAFMITGAFLSKHMSSNISLDIPEYTDNYKVSFGQLYLNGISNFRIVLDALSAPLKVSAIILVIIAFLAKTKKHLMNIDFLYWVLVSVMFFAILIPWKHVLERYHLVNLYSLTLSISYLLQIATNLILDKFGNIKIMKWTFGVFIFVVVANLLSKNFSISLAKTINYSEWHHIFNNYEGNIVEDIAKCNTSVVYINASETIDNWEFMYEVPIHLKYIYGTDMDINYLEDNPMLVKGCVLEASTLVSNNKISTNKYGTMIQSREYVVSQIDPIGYRYNFIRKPVQTYIDPPLSNNNFKYSWSIYE